MGKERPPLLCGALCLAVLFVWGCAPNGASFSPGHYSDAGLSQPDDYDQGVVLAWREGTLPVDNTINTIAVGDTVVVRMRNLDGWLIRVLKTGQITGEPAMSVAQKDNYLLLQKLLDHFKNNPAARKALKDSINAGGPALVAQAADMPPDVPADVTFNNLLDAKIAYNTLLNVVKRGLFLVVNNSQFRQIRAENPDALSDNDVPKDKDDDTLHELEFRLRRLPGDEDAWSSLYDGTKAIHNVRVSVGVGLDKNVYVFDTAVFPQAENKVQRVQLVLYQSSWLWGVTAVLILVLLGGIYLSAKTPLLRDTDVPLRADGCPQFSLSRLQLACWTYLAVGAFLIIWLVTDRLDTLNTTILALLGISSGTLLASKIANTSTLESTDTRAEVERAMRRGKSCQVLCEELENELQTVEAALRDRIAAGDANVADLSIRLQGLKDDLDYLRQGRISRFFNDLLAENGRVTVHRLQILIWTGVLVVVFVKKVMSELSMPVFSETLLGLMGLSSATYIALKIPELKQVQSDINTVAKQDKK
jgi:hypothetical protein